MEKDCDFCDLVADKCYKMYGNLGKIGAKPKDGIEWTLMSAFLIETQTNTGSVLEVVSIGTGTKCIGQNSMSPHGDVLNDSHAEILARRAFLRYVYSEIEKTYVYGSSDIFMGYDDDRKCCLRENVKFHMFTSHVPCGDASIIPIIVTKRKCEDDSDAGNVKKIKPDNCVSPKVEEVSMSDPENIGFIVDIHRTGAKCLPGDNKQDSKHSAFDYHTTGPVRTKPGRGSPTLSVSCSDKIARWLYTGVQGALLSLLIKNNQSLLISTITVGGGGQFDKGVMYRALIERSKLTDSCGELPQLYRSNLVFCHSRLFVSSGSKPSHTSIIWFKNTSGKRLFEVAVDGRKQGWTKKSKGGSNLSVTKIEFFKLFLKLSNFDCDVPYRLVKNSAYKYQEKVKCFKNLMGAWTRKDSVLEQFICTAQDIPKIS